jgi:L-iditol 2-dehydrogenase
VPAPNVRHATFGVPDHLSDEAASFVEPLACCLRAVERAAVLAGDTVAVVGLGSIGGLLVQLARRAEAQVVGVDVIAARADLARRLGAGVAGDAATAAAAVSELSEGRGADHVFITGGGTDAVAWSTDVVRDGGSVHCFAAGPGETIPLALEPLYHRELTLTATYSSSPRTLAAAFRLIAEGAVAVDRLVTHRVPLARLPEGVELMRRREAMKVFVTP